MQASLQRFSAIGFGVLHGFGRLRFRGSKRQLCHVTGMMSWLGYLRILLKEYEAFTRDTTASLCKAIEGPAEQAGLHCFLNNSQASKEETALQRAAKQGLTQGPIAVLGCVEPCQTLRVRQNPQKTKLELRAELTKCKHYYHYYLDPVCGLLYTRLQTRFPFTMHIGLNGRDWLAQQMTALTAEESKRQPARVTRLLRLLRGHRLIARIAKTHRYQPTEKGRSILSALLAARQAKTKQLLQTA